MRVALILALIAILCSTALAQEGVDVVIDRNESSAGIMAGTVFAQQRYTLPGGREDHVTDVSGALFFHFDVPLGSDLGIRVQWALTKGTAKRTLADEQWAPDASVRFRERISTPSLWLMSVPLLLKYSPFRGAARPYLLAGGYVGVLSGNEYISDERIFWTDDPANPQNGFPEEIVSYRRDVMAGLNAGVGIEFRVFSSMSVLLEGGVSTVLTTLSDDHFTVRSWPRYHTAEHGSFSWNTTRLELRAGVSLH